MITGKPWDAIVVGAGPAGSAVAALLARAGWRVLIVDASHFPRSKVCGEFLAAAAGPALDRLGVHDALRTDGISIGEMELHLPDSAPLRVPLVDSAGRLALAVSRYRLDNCVLNAALSAGASCEQGYRVRAIERHGELLQVTASRESSVEHLVWQAPLVIAADGRHSVVVRATGHTRRHTTRLVGFKRHWRPAAGTAPRPSLTSADPVLEMHAFVGGYVGICPVEDGAWNVCGVLPKHLLREARGSLELALRGWERGEQVLARFPHALAREPHNAAQQADRAEVEFTPLAPDGPWQTIADVSTQRSLPTQPGVLYVGDAAGTIEPVAGLGMTMALRSAVMAAEILTDVGPERVDAKVQAEYAARWNTAFGRSVRRSRRSGALLRHVGRLGPLLSLVTRIPRLEQRIVGTLYAQLHAGTL